MYIQYNTMYIKYTYGYTQTNLPSHTHTNKQTHSTWKYFFNWPAGLASGYKYSHMHTCVFTCEYASICMQSCRMDNIIYMETLFVKLWLFLICLHNHHLSLFLAKCASWAGKQMPKHLQEIASLCSVFWCVTLSNKVLDTCWLLQKAGDW